MRNIAGVGCVVALALVGAASAAAPGQTYPGQPTQARVYVENHGIQQAVPISIQQIAADAMLKVQVAGTPVVEARPVRQTWEYQRVVVQPDDDVTAELNRLGAAGWETAFQHANGRGGIVIVLKRPR